MSKIKVALELDLKVGAERSLYGLIGQYLAGEEVKQEAPKAGAPKAEAPKAEAPKAEAPKAEAPKAEAPKAEAPKAETPVVAPTATMVDLTQKAQALIASDQANGTTNGQQLRAWMSERGHPGRVAELPKALWDEFNAFMDSLSI